MAHTQSPSRTQLIHDRARFMRFNPTYSEALLWSAIRGKRLGVQFRRQRVIGSTIVDLFCASAFLIVEVDGDLLHAHRATRDARRDAKLRRAGYRVLRIPASLVEKDLEAAVGMVRVALAASDDGKGYGDRRQVSCSASGTSPEAQKERRDNSSRP